MYFHSEIRTFAKPALRLDGSAHKADGLFRYRHAKTRACVFRACAMCSRQNGYSKQRYQNIVWYFSVWL